MEHIKQNACGEIHISTASLLKGKFLLGRAGGCTSKRSSERKEMQHMERSRFCSFAESRKEDGGEASVQVDGLREEGSDRVFRREAETGCTKKGSDALAEL